MNLGRLGSFELHGISNTFGNQLGDDWGAMGPPPQIYGGEIDGGTREEAEQLERMMSLSKKHGDLSKASDAELGSVGFSVSAGEIMGGIGAILGPLMQAGVGIYAAQQQAEMAKNQIVQAPGVNYAQQYPSAPPAKSPALFIILGLVVLMMMGGMMFMMSKKGGAPAPAYGPPPPRPAHAPPQAVPFAYQPAPPPPPQIRRRRKKKRRRRPSK